MRLRLFGLTLTLLSIWLVGSWVLLRTASAEQPTVEYVLLSGTLQSNGTDTDEGYFYINTSQTAADRPATMIWVHPYGMPAVRLRELIGKPVTLIIRRDP